MNSLRLLGWLAAALLGGFRAYASPCLPGSLASYQGLGGTGCEIGLFTVKDFGFSVLATNLGSPLNSGAINVTPSLSATLNLNFAAAFSVTSNQFSTYLISYTVDPPPILSGMEDEMITQTPVAPGIATVTTSLCVGAAFTPPPTGTTCGGSLTSFSVFHAGTTSDTIESIAFGPTNILGVRNVIDLQGNVGGSASFSSFDNRVEAVPEPSTLGMIAAGGLLLVFRRLSDAGWRRPGPGKR